VNVVAQPPQFGVHDFERKAHQLRVATVSLSEIVAIKEHMIGQKVLE
jgi:hypothetical protein